MDGLMGALPHTVALRGGVYRLLRPAEEVSTLEEGAWGRSLLKGFAPTGPAQAKT